MVKKQALVALVSLVSIFSTAFGLGLGDIKVNSNLNDPLEAEINLLQLQGLTAGEILPTLASNDDFRRAGVERSFFLSNIQFRTAENESGEVVIRLSTKQAVREPFLNFLVEVNWPGGRLLKEYTVLLDPPIFDTGLAVDALEVDRADRQQAAQPSTSLMTKTVIDSANVDDVVTQPEAFVPRDDTVGPGQYRVQRNDTLWEIALKVPDRAGYSPHQVMLAIQDLNPEAFLGNNINRVKAGSVLNLPDAAQIGSRTLQEAVEEVQAQNQGSVATPRSSVSESASEVQLSATESTASAMPSADGVKNPDGYLELTSETESSSATASGETDATIDQLQSQLAAVEELNDQYQRERQDLEGQVQELQEQIKIMERLLEVQNSDLAEIQEAVTVADSQMAEANQGVEPQMDTGAVEPVQPMPAPAEPVQPAQPTSAPTQPAPVTPPPVPQPEPGIMGFVNSALGWLTGSITNMAIVIGVVLVLILVPLYLRSKRNNEEEESLEGYGDLPEEGEAEIDITPTIDEDLLSAVEDDFEEDIVEEPEALDAVVEAEMYMAYQKFDQAEEKLKEAYAEYPDRMDVAVKLLEVYAETGDANAFNSLEGQLSLSAEQQATVADLRSKLPAGMPADGDDLVPELSTDDFDLDLSAGDTTTADAGLGSDLDFDLDLGSDDDSSSDLDLDSTPADESSSDLDFNIDTADSLDITESAPSAENALELESDLDFSLDLDGLDTPEIEEESGSNVEASSNDSDLDFSLDLDSSDLSLDDEPASTDSAVELDELADLDFGSDDLSLDSSDSDTEIDTGLDLSLDEELSLDEDLSLDSTPDETPTLSIAEDSTDELTDLSIDSDLDLDLGSDDADLGLDLGSEGMAGDDPLQQLADSLDSDADLEEDEFDFLSGNDEASTKLDLARAYIEMDDKEGARDILEEVASEGNDDQKAQAKELLGQL